MVKLLGLKGIKVNYESVNHPVCQPSANCFMPGNESGLIVYFGIYFFLTDQGF
jgi:hypothetical protein